MIAWLLFGLAGFLLDVLLHYKFQSNDENDDNILTIFIIEVCFGVLTFALMCCVAITRCITYLINKFNS